MARLGRALSLPQSKQECLADGVAMVADPFVDMRFNPMGQTGKWSSPFVPREECALGKGLSHRAL